jgi:hypothetical protein
VSGIYLPVIGTALVHGPWVAAAASLAVTPGGLWILALVLERRRPGIRTGFVAVAVGDPLLALATAFGVQRMHGAPPTGAAGPWFGLASLICWSGYGLVQWATERRQGFFTREQAVAPSKIWHQLAVYPLLGYWLWTAAIGGLTAPGSRPADIVARIVIVGCIGVWAVGNVYDRRHPKLGHPPYDWRRLRPFDQPWPGTSTTLRAYRDALLPGSAQPIPSPTAPQAQDSPPIPTTIIRQDPNGLPTARTAIAHFQQPGGNPDNAVTPDA